MKDDEDVYNNKMKEENEKMKNALKNIVQLIEENDYECQEGYVNLNQHQLHDVQTSVAATLTTEFS